MKPKKPIMFHRIIKNVILLILLITFIYSFMYNLFALFKINASFFGVNVFSADSNTMSPELRKGYLVISFNTSPKNIKENDIIVYEKDESYKIRRVMSVRDNNGTKNFVVKGDNTYYMEETTPDCIQGKMIAKAPYMGNILKIVQSIIFTIVVLIFFAFIYIRRRNIRKRNERRKGARGKKA